MELYRITQEKFANDLSGNGSRLFGGRWNSEGRYALYTASHRSLALLETLVHTPAKFLGSNTYILITVVVPDHSSGQVIDEGELPKDWDALDVPQETQLMGDKFLTEQKNLLLRVPSVLMPEEFNYVLNPLHPSMKQVKISHHREIKFNDRLVKGI